MVYHTEDLAGGHCEDGADHEADVPQGGKERTSPPRGSRGRVLSRGRLALAGDTSLYITNCARYIVRHTL